MSLPSSSANARKTSASALRLIAALALGASLGWMSGCASSGDASAATEVAVLQETPSPHQILVEKGGQPPAACVISVNQKPPAPKEETVLKRPDKLHVWIKGNWRYYSSHYVWIPGQWSLPPKPGAVYTPPRWSVLNGNSIFTEGYWHF